MAELTESLNTPEDRVKITLAWIAWCPGCGQAHIFLPCFVELYLPRFSQLCGHCNKSFWVGEASFHEYQDLGKIKEKKEDMSQTTREAVDEMAIQEPAISVRTVWEFSCPSCKKTNTYIPGLGTLPTGETIRTACRHCGFIFYIKNALGEADET